MRILEEIESPNVYMFLKVPFFPWEEYYVAELHLDRGPDSEHWKIKSTDEKEVTKYYKAWKKENKV